MKSSLLLSLLLLLSNCSKDDDSFTPILPPITQTGANTFGCYVDGKLLTPRDGTGTFNYPDYGMSFIAGPGPTDFTYNEIAIHDYKSGTGGLLDIHITDLHQNGEGAFLINESNCQDGIDANPTINIRCRWWDESLQAYKWYCSIENTGNLIITRYDYTNSIVSGTFSCRGQNRDDATDIIEITEGRFDVKWSTLPETEFL
jgi:hypothetical protein